MARQPARSAGQHAASGYRAPHGDTHAAQRFEAVLDTILAVCRVAADELTPLVPEGAARLAAQLNLNEANKHASAFPRITERASVQHR